MKCDMLLYFWKTSLQSMYYYTNLQIYWRQNVWRGICVLKDIFFLNVKGPVCLGLCSYKHKTSSWMSKFAKTTEVLNMHGVSSASTNCVKYKMTKMSTTIFGFWNENLNGEHPAATN